MGYDEISVRTSIMRDIAEKVEKQSSETPYNSNDLDDYLAGNNGKARNGLFEVNSTTDTCAHVTRQLIECTSRFLSNTADIFDENDCAIAKEVSNS